MPLTELVYCVTAVVQAFGQSITLPMSVIPLYSPDLAPYDLWFFPKLKSQFKGGDL
jgi:hypothetical protein